MRLYFGGHLNFYHPQQEHWLEVEIDRLTPLIEVLTGLDIPLGEVHMVVVNGQAVNLEDTLVNEDDEVKLYSAVGGG